MFLFAVSRKLGLFAFNVKLSNFSRALCYNNNYY